MTPTSRRGDAHVTQTTHEPSVEPKDTSSSASGPLTEDDLEAFGAFWLTYPKRKNRPAAIEAWKAAVASGVSPARIVAAAQAYARECASTDTEPRFIKYPANWLRDGRYDDEPDQPANGRRLRTVGPQTAPRDMTDEEIASALQFG